MAWKFKPRADYGGRCSSAGGCCPLLLADSCAAISAGVGTLKAWRSLVGEAWERVTVQTCCGCVQPWHEWPLPRYCSCRHNRDGSILWGTTALCSASTRGHCLRQILTTSIFYWAEFLDSLVCAFGVHFPKQSSTWNAGMAPGRGGSAKVRKLSLGESMHHLLPLF